MLKDYNLNYVIYKQSKRSNIVYQKNVVHVQKLPLKCVRSNNRLTVV